ncbi:MAG TPA: hypothetical protein VFX43_05790 [Chitinophagaceae bacterium]|jgi:hypothetical protein|nr:hypothetical protein [Chitinophagaceae bacterium]
MKPSLNETGYNPRNYGDLLPRSYYFVGLLGARGRITEAQDPRFRDKVVKVIMSRIGALYEIERKIRGQSP